MTDKPNKTYKLGLISVSVWEKEGMATSYSIQKAYKKDDAWHYTANFNVSDLPTIQSLLDIVVKKEYHLFKDE